ncbi:secreted chorismate mutase (plasmid) [Mycolicibacterium arabiense]|uniref:chorismate mutase n=1 Tax=Mycolicibacterium arabiense TaxID=1286181 RepID=A0A7I7RQE6_9MYCO|nr:gamma subclass chorismate mutase AroQ [Mycolicibacterium arabiense]MCV7372181.1 gamma subclass chorismate mutase AroQ [Mycolicibacterium arabiense]BBY46798.1 secreted chorismate mutase [Mycolicibacterium arabiense]
MTLESSRRGWLGFPRLKRSNDIEPRDDLQIPNRFLGVVDLAGQRLQTAHPIAAWKYRSGGSVDDPEREQQVIASVTERAVARDVEPGYVADVFRDQIDANVALQHALFARWRLDDCEPADCDGGLPVWRNIVDTVNRAMLDQVVRNWDRLQCNSFRHEIDEALGIVGRARGLDSIQVVALTYATRRYCRTSV